jgi:phage terminase large subunit-like protein
MTSPLAEPLVGVQQPRISNVPSYNGSSGDDAVELAAMAGLYLDPWQQHVLRGSCGERNDGSWAAFEVGVVVPRQNGKGSLLEARELAGLFLFGEQTILHSAHEFKTAQEAFLRIRALIRGAPQLEKRVKRAPMGHGDECIELTSGARLRFVARSTGSGRGFSGDLVILDEAYNLSAEAMAALLPTLSARPNPQVWYTSTAGMDTSDQLARVRARGVEGSSPRLAYFEWSTESGASLDDPASWAQANPALGYRITSEFVASERAALPDLEFARERLGVWFDGAAETVVDMNLWARLADPTSQVLDPVVFAVDATPDRAAAAIAVCGRREDELLHVEIVQHDSGTAWVPDRVVELQQRWSPRAVVLDPAGPAGSLITAFQERGVEPVLVSAREVAQACGAFHDAVAERQAIRHLDQAMLNAALAGAKPRPLGDAWAWHRKNSLVDISPLVAATLAIHGFSVHGHEVSYDVLASVF